MRIGTSNPRVMVLIAVPTTAVLALVAIGILRPANPTFSRDVLPIVQQKCQNCHRPDGLNLGGMVAPMPFTSYEEVRTWAGAIKLAVETRRMPPWHAAPEFQGVFANERYLTDDEIATIVRWVEDGAPEGDPADSPPPVTFASQATSGGWSIGEPDLIVRLPEPYLVRDDVEDEYVDFSVTITDDMLPKDRWIKSVEFRPGSKAVHHVIARPLGGIAPGYEPREYPDGYSRLLRTGTRVNFQMHYHKTAGPGTAVYDQTEAAVRFYKPGEEIRHVVQTNSLGMYRFVIPSGDSSYSYSLADTVERDIKVLWLNPHMHLRGKAAKYIATYPDAREEVVLHVPKYDFNWQHTYRFRELLFLPKGTRIELTLWWDNSTNNPANPNPNRDVRWGRPTTDEMGYGWMYYAETKPRSIIVGEPIPDDLPRTSAFGRRTRRSSDNR